MGLWSWLSNRFGARPRDPLPARPAKALPPSPFKAILPRAPDELPTQPPEAHWVAPHFEPTGEFERVLEMARSKDGHEFIFVSGRAGTGKTSLIRWLREKLDDRNVAVVAPTGLAALTAGGQTIHSFFGFPPRVIEEEDIKERNDPEIFVGLNLLVIDEVSMVSCEMLDAIDAFLRKNRRDPRPFGGLRVMAVGDLFQLPPITRKPDRERLKKKKYASEFFFNAHCLSGVRIDFVELTRTFRQTDEKFLALLRSIRNGVGDDAVDTLNTICCRPVPDPSTWLAAVPRRKTAEVINQRQLELLPGQAREYFGELKGHFPSRRHVDSNPTKDLPAPYVLTLKQGARVMFTKNDADGRWVNGTMGTVKALTARYVDVAIDLSHDVVDVIPATWTSEEYVWDPDHEKLDLKEIGCYRQFPLTPAWAVTIHKVQGQTLDRVSVDLEDGAFCSGQTYVAVSRARSMDGLRLKRPMTSSDVICDRRVREFMRSLAPLESHGTPSQPDSSGGGSDDIDRESTDWDWWPDQSLGGESSRN